MDTIVCWPPAQVCLTQRLAVQWMGCTYGVFRFSVCDRRTFTDVSVVIGLWASVAVYLRLVIERCQKCCLPAAVQPFHGTVCLSLYCFHAVS